MLVRVQTDLGVFLVADGVGMKALLVLVESIWEVSLAAVWSGPRMSYDMFGAWLQRYSHHCISRTDAASGSGVGKSVSKSGVDKSISRSGVGEFPKCSLKLSTLKRDSILGLTRQAKKLGSPSMRGETEPTKGERCI